METSNDPLPEWAPREAGKALGSQASSPDKRLEQALRAVAWGETLLATVLAEQRLIVETAARGEELWKAKLVEASLAQQALEAKAQQLAAALDETRPRLRAVHADFSKTRKNLSDLERAIRGYLENAGGASASQGMSFQAVRIFLEQIRMETEGFEKLGSALRELTQMQAAADWPPREETK
jgi:outer membrane murein-binding lipoprotein Lpp